MLIIKPKKGVELLIVEVPEGVIRLHVSVGILYGTTGQWDKGTQIENDFQKLLPLKNEWEYLATSKDITEEQAAELVDNASIQFMMYKDYDKGTLAFARAVDSLFSLLRSQGLDPSTKNYAMLKKIMRYERYKVSLLEYRR